MTCGDIRIEPSARLHVEVYANRVTILGTVRGPVFAVESVEVGPTGHVIGNIKAPRIVVREGALIEGRCEMTRPQTPEPTTSTPTATEGDAAAATSDAPVSQPPSPVVEPRPRPRPLAPPRPAKPAPG